MPYLYTSAPVEADQPESKTKNVLEVTYLNKERTVRRVRVRKEDIPFQWSKWRAAHGVIWYPDEWQEDVRMGDLKVHRRATT